MKSFTKHKNKTVFEELSVVKSFHNSKYSLKKSMKITYNFVSSIVFVFIFMLYETIFIFMLNGTNFVFMLFALMLIGTYLVQASASLN